MDGRGVRLTHVRAGGCRGVFLFSAGISGPGVCHPCQVWQALRQRQAGFALQETMADGMQHGIHCFSQFLQGRSPQGLFKGRVTGTGDVLPRGGLPRRHTKGICLPAANIAEQAGRTFP